MSDQEGPCCTHMRVAYGTEPAGEGTVRGFWSCALCGHRFAPLARIAALEAELAMKCEYAKDLDDLLLRFAFDAGALGDERVSELGVDPWGTLADFRRAFGLAPTMTPEEWAEKTSALAPPSAEEKP